MSGLDSTYGALFIGVLVSAVLFGLTMLQVFVYFQHYPADRRWRKVAVFWLWFLDAFHFSLSAHFIYFYLVTNFDNPSALLTVIWSYKVRMISYGFVVISVHTLYTFQLWTLRGIDENVEPFKAEDRRWSSQKITLQKSAARWIMRRVVPYLVGVLVVIGYGKLRAVMCSETYRLDTFDRLSHAPFATYVPLVCSTLTDIVIAGSLCYFLAQCQTEFGAMNGVLRKLMFYTVNTGIVTSLCSIIAISMMIAYPATFITAAIEFLVIKLYINSYLAMLNARGGTRDGLHRTPPGFTPNASFILQNVGPPEHKHQLFLSGFPPSSSSVHLGHPGQPHVQFQSIRERDTCPAELYAFQFPTSGRSDSLASEEPFLPRAPRLSHPDVALPEYDESVRLSHPFAAGTGAQTQVDLPTLMLAEQLAITPPMPESVSPRSRPIDARPLSPEPEPRHEYSGPWAQRRPSCAHSTTLSTIPSVSSRTSVPSREQHHPQDYPSPPERALSLSPLHFGTASLGPAASFDVDVDIVEGGGPPVVYAQRDKDKYSRMVRSARGWGSRSASKPRRALFDAERGVAVMWGLHEERMARAAA
ncbi:hypothetical protein BD310DRAFT_829972 [Dichomitus squalens]|uniref:DUF6534 domain-containing protein n=1 Tax=Dichomitus squalens TaxID=114155 RepID=A0A4Q9PFB2_9APHY|nr:hypothetical protein BD310DRAFT_829972 [Dichomitus squalens]